MYSTDHRVGYSEVDENRDIRIVELVNRLQDCSVFQAEEFGVGLAGLAERGLAWVLVATRIEIDRFPRLFGKITVSTWCYEVKRFAARRGFIVADESGRTILRGDGLYAMFSTELGHSCTVPDDERGYVSDVPRAEMAPLERRLSLGPDPAGLPEIVVAKHHIDTNAHVNNAQYIQIALDALEAGGRIVDRRSVRAIDVHYRSQARMGDIIRPRFSEDAGALTVALESAEGDEYAVVRLSCDGSTD